MDGVCTNTAAAVLQLVLYVSIVFFFLLYLIFAVISGNNVTSVWKCHFKYRIRLFIVLVVLLSHSLTTTKKVWRKWALSCFNTPLPSFYLCTCCCRFSTTTYNSVNLHCFAKIWSIVSGVLGRWDHEPVNHIYVYSLVLWLFSVFVCTKRQHWTAALHLILLYRTWDAACF